VLSPLWINATTGDSDFSPLVSKLRENDRYVIGLGVKSSSSDLLVANCDEFIFYEDLIRETKKTRTMTYCNSEGGTYRVRVVLHRTSGRLETFKYKGEKLVARATGRDFESAMVHTTLVGIEKDERVRVVRC